LNRAVLINPKSGRGGKGIGLSRHLGAHPRVMVRMLDDFSQLPEILAEMGRAEIDELFISSGDGTIHAILTEIAESRPFPSLPKVGILPHGKTNLTAGDLGLRLPSRAAEAGFIAGKAASLTKPRSTLRVVNPRDGRVRHGMFVGTGAASTGTRFCQQVFHGTGVTGKWATSATLLSAVARALFTRGHPDDRKRLDRAYVIGFTIGNDAFPPAPRLFLMASTLDRLLLGARPFWGGKRAPIRVSIVPYPIPSVLRWMLPMMYGGENRRAPKGAASWSTDHLTVSTREEFVIDGEFFDPPSNEPLQIETGPSFTFICG
jgi:diacylglycerol kinase (ATP)